MRRDLGLAVNRAAGQIGSHREPDLDCERRRGDLMRDHRRRHRGNDAVAQLVVPLVVRAGVEKLLDGQQLVGGLHELSLARPTSGCQRGCAKSTPTDASGGAAAAGKFRRTHAERGRRR
jgi:hypothetical protein